MEKVYEAEYAGHPVRFAFLEPQTRQHFKFWLKPVEGEYYDIKATPELVKHVLAHMPEENPEYYAEYKALIGPTSAFLLRFRCCIFHAVAFLWQGKAWLLTAPSGTGKSTQFMNWRRLHPAEITMICGDMPVLELREDDSVWVHSSNWNGKEGIGSKTRSYFWINAFVREFIATVYAERKKHILVIALMILLTIAMVVLVYLSNNL